MTQEVRRSRLMIVNLADSETMRPDFKNNSPRYNPKDLGVNKSILALNECILALSQNKNTHVPYRNSKLTRILEESLKGNCQTYIIATIEATSLGYEQTFATLRFVQKARKLKTQLKQNKFTSKKLHISQCKNVIQNLEQELGYLQKEYVRCNSEKISPRLAQEVETEQVAEFRKRSQSTPYRMKQPDDYSMEDGLSSLGFKLPSEIEQISKHLELIFEKEIHAKKALECTLNDKFQAELKLKLMNEKEKASITSQRSFMPQLLCQSLESSPNPLKRLESLSPSRQIQTERKGTSLRDESDLLQINKKLDDSLPVLEVNMDQVKHSLVRNRSESLSSSVAKLKKLMLLQEETVKREKERLRKKIQDLEKRRHQQEQKFKALLFRREQLEKQWNSIEAQNGAGPSQKYLHYMKTHQNHSLKKVQLISKHEILEQEHKHKDQKIRMLSEQLRLRDEMISKAEELIEKQERMSSLESHDTQDQRIAAFSESRGLEPSSEVDRSISEEEKKRKILTLKTLNLKIMKGKALRRNESPYEETPFFKIEEIIQEQQPSISRRSNSVPNVSKEQAKPLKKKDSLLQKLNRFPVTPSLLQADQRNKILAQVYLPKEKAVNGQNFSLKQVKAVHNLQRQEQVTTPLRMSHLIRYNSTPRIRGTEGLSKNGKGSRNEAEGAPFFSEKRVKRKNSCSDVHQQRAVFNPGKKRQSSNDLLNKRSEFQKEKFPTLRELKTKVRANYCS